MRPILMATGSLPRRSWQLLFLHFFGFPRRFFFAARWSVAYPKSCHRALRSLANNSFSCDSHCRSLPKAALKAHRKALTSEWTTSRQQHKTKMSCMSRRRFLCVASVLVAALTKSNALAAMLFGTDSGHDLICMSNGFAFARNALACSLVASEIICTTSTTTVCNRTRRRVQERSTRSHDPVCLWGWQAFEVW